MHWFAIQEHAGGGLGRAKAKTCVPWAGVEVAEGGGAGGGAVGTEGAGGIFSLLRWALGHPMGNLLGQPRSGQQARGCIVLDAQLAILRALGAG